LRKYIPRNSIYLSLMRQCNSISIHPRLNNFKKMLLYYNSDKDSIEIVKITQNYKLSIKKTNKKKQYPKHSQTTTFTKIPKCEGKKVKPQTKLFDDGFFFLKIGFSPINNPNLSKKAIMKN
jgi:hypothetical protein